MEVHNDRKTQFISEPTAINRGTVYQGEESSLCSCSCFTSITSLISSIWHWFMSFFTSSEKAKDNDTNISLPAEVNKPLSNNAESLLLELEGNFCHSDARERICWRIFTAEKLLSCRLSKEQENRYKNMLWGMWKQMGMNDLSILDLHPKEAVKALWKNFDKWKYEKRVSPATRAELATLREKLKDKTIVDVIDNGDCFPEAFAVALTKLTGQPHSAYTIRKIVESEAPKRRADIEGDAKWGGYNDWNDYLSKVGKTYELLVVTNALPIWLRPHFEGELLANYFGVTLVVHDVRQTQTFGKGAKTIEIAHYGSHFDAVLPT